MNDARHFAAPAPPATLATLARNIGLALISLTFSPIDGMVST